MPRAVALFSGGLDSTLAVRIVAEQGFAVHALHVRTLSDGAGNQAEEAAASLGIALTVLPVGDDYLDLVRRPRFGYGRGMNPCIDCRIYMCRMAKRLMEELGAEMVVSGEVLGQRPMSQRRQDLLAIAKHSGLGNRLLRPLSAQLLPPTLPETVGLVDRARLYGFTGTGRRKLIELARRLGIREIPGPSGGCILADRSTAARVRDLLRYRPDASRWDFELARGGRHFRYSEATKIVLSRRAAEDTWLQAVARQGHPATTAILVPENFPGPSALLVGTAGNAAVQFAGALILARCRQVDPAKAQFRVTRAGETRVIRVEPQAAAASAKSVDEDCSSQESRNAR
jgi:tRNA(Ile)-lysidine synthase TilS/MesJ